jgi:molecular chaperone GrpE (heat shock protein)
MLVELAAFNAAYATVKATLSAGRDIADCAAGIGKMMSAEADLKEKASKKKDSIWFALAGKDTNDFEEFMALETIRNQRAELLQTLQLYGRAGLKDDFLRFEAIQRKKRKDERAEIERQKEALIEKFVYGLIALILLAGFAGFIFFALKIKGVV